MRRASLFMAAAMVTGLGLSSAFADRMPTYEEYQQLDTVLKERGYVSWESIELEDGNIWEVDNAINAQGEEYDLELRVGTLEIIKEERDR